MWFERTERVPQGCDVRFSTGVRSVTTSGNGISVTLSVCLGELLRPYERLPSRQDSEEAFPFRSS
jgi:hypothetical protein